MAGFLEAGFGIFVLIVIFNIMLLGFGGIDSSSIIGLNEASACSSGDSYISPTSNPEQGTGGSTQAVCSLGYIIGIVSRILFTAGDMITQVGIPFPINFILSTVINVFMTGYLALLIYTGISAFFGGGVGGA